MIDFDNSAKAETRAKSASSDDTSDISFLFGHVSALLIVDTHISFGGFETRIAIIRSRLCESRVNDSRTTTCYTRFNCDVLSRRGHSLILANSSTRRPAGLAESRGASRVNYETKCRRESTRREYRDIESWINCPPPPFRTRVVYIAGSKVCD